MALAIEDCTLIGNLRTAALVGRERAAATRKGELRQAIRALAAPRPAASMEPFVPGGFEPAGTVLRFVRWNRPSQPPKTGLLPIHP